jgi:divalent metal cation (Fe/Co/Zn/Cd) transporter
MKPLKLGALGAVGVALGLLALYLFLCWVSLSRTITGGMDHIHQNVAWISILIAVLAIVAVHLTFAKVLWDAARGKRSTY